jgi:ABC-type multidrug transport system ATPase subunit
VNGRNKGEFGSGYSQLSAYVQQDDVLFQTMTVRECFEFAAKLKLHGSMESKLQRVENLLATLKLFKAQNTLIGGALVKGISGGERKRTAVGVELITDPSMLFLDEPTTGLDSYIATQVMENLRDLAMVYGKTVISTIHQPNTDVYEMFDKLMLLAQGKVIYYNDATKAVGYWASIGREVPDMTNPADYFMTMMAKDGIDVTELVSKAEYAGLTPDEIRQEEYNIYVEYYDKCYQESDLKNDPTILCPDLPQLKVNASGKLATGFIFQFKLLARRNFLNMIRLPQTSYVKAMTTIATALFACLLFWNVPHTNQGIQNIQGALFFVCMNTVLNAVQNVILIFPEERPCFLREVNNNMYGPSPYFWAKIVSELPFSTIQPTVFCLIIYFVIGLNDVNAGYFFTFLLIVILTYNAAQGYALVISAAFSDKQLAVTLTPVLIIPFMLFAGFFASTDSIPVELLIFQYSSIFMYAYNALLLNQFVIFETPEG